MSTSTIFSGTSRFSSDFQQIITRTVAIASLPIDQLTSQKTVLQNQSSALTALTNAFAPLQSALEQLNASTSLSSYSTSTSNGSIAHATVSAGANVGSYSLEVTDLGTFTNTLSSDGLPTVADPATHSVSSAISFSLSVNGVATTIKPASNTLNGLVSAINGTAGINVQASIVNIGSSHAPDYRLTIQSTKLGPVNVHLSDSSGDLLNTLSTGSLATYKVNGLSTVISSDSRTVTLAPQLTVDLIGKSTPGDATSITVSRSTAGIETALTAFVNAYNGAIDQLDKNRGGNQGALGGQNIVFTLTNTLRALAHYSNGSSGISGLSNIGITFDKTGHLSFDTSVLQGASSDGLASITSFLGSSTSDGFLKSASVLITSLQDPTSGSLFLASDSLNKLITKQGEQISASQNRVDLLKQNLQRQIAAADALIATLEQSVTLITGIFDAQLNSNKK